MEKSGGGDVYATKTETKGLISFWESNWTNGIMLPCSHGNHACRQRQGELTSGRNPVDVSEQLALGHPWVPHEEDIDVPPDLHAVGGAVHAPHQEQQQGFLDVLVTIDLGSEGTGKLLVEIIL